MAGRRGNDELGRDPRFSGAPRAPGPIGAMQVTDTHTTAAGSFEVHTEARGKHWVAWVTRPGDANPVRSVVIVAQTREEAERRGQQWAGRLDPAHP